MPFKNPRVYNANQYRISKQPKRTKNSAGSWRGDNAAQLRLRAVFIGTAPLLIKQIDGFEDDPPSIIEPVLSMALRAGAHHAGPLMRKYVPNRHTGDFLPFLMVDACKLRYRHHRIFQRPVFGSGGKKEGVVIGHRPTHRVTDWKLESEIVVAHMPGVDEQGIMAMFAKAGSEVGLGACRPHEGGKSGTFKLDKLEIVSGSWPPPIVRLSRDDDRNVDVGEQIEAIRADVNADDPDAELD
jgi:hypothetical protein